MRIVKNLNGSEGYCDFNSRIIKVADVSRNEDDLALLLIHEFAHAATASYHGKRWLTRLAVAAQRAKEIGRLGLASLLWMEIDDYRDHPRETAARSGDS